MTSSEDLRGGKKGAKRREGAADQAAAEARRLSLRHFRFGWWSLLLFLSLGIVLEALLAWRTGAYLDVGNETRRLLWRLAHAHGTLLSLVNIAFALTVGLVGLSQPRLKHVASPCLMLAAVLIPVGFFLGGAFTYGSDPGPGTLLTPVGALFLFTAVLLTALEVARRR